MDNLTVISIIGALIILTYIIFIFNGGYSYNQWWFGLNKTKFLGINFLTWFAITSLLAATGFIYVMWYYKSKLEDELTKKQYDKIFTEIVISLIASLVWAPAVYYSIKYKSNKNRKNFFKAIAIISLGVTTGASAAATYFINDYAKSNTYKTIAIIAYSLFIFHTGFVDFYLWNSYYKCF